MPEPNSTNLRLQPNPINNPNSNLCHSPFSVQQEIFILAFFDPFFNSSISIGLPRSQWSLAMIHDQPTLEQCHFLNLF